MNRLWRASTLFRGYPLAAAIAMAGIVVRLALRPVIDLDAPFLLSEPAIALAAWLCGFGPGLLAMLLSAAFALGALGALVPGGEAVEIEPLVGRLVVFISVGAGVAWLASALRRTWQEERTRREELTAILDSVADGVTVIDPEGVIRYANATAARQMGRQHASEVVGHHGAEMAGQFELLDADGRPMNLARLPTRRAMAGEEGPEETVRYRSPGGVDRWSIVRARAIRNASGGPRLTVSAFQDVTPLKRSELRLLFLARLSSVLAESVDYDVTLRRAAELATPDLGDWCAVDVIEADGVRRVAIAHPDPELRSLAEEAQRRWPPTADGPSAVQSAMESRQPVHVPEVTDEMLRQAAQSDEHLAMLRRLDIHAALTVPLIARDSVVGALTLVMAESGRAFDPADITLAEEAGRRVGAAIDTARLLRESQDAVRLRDQFMAVASHDMRTPLATVRGYAQLLRRRLTGAGLQNDGPLLDMVDKIDESAGRLTRMVSEFLDASLIRGGEQLNLEIERMDIVRLTRDIVQEHRTQLASKHRIALEVDAEQAVVAVDPSRMARVVDNLLTNAVKFSPEGGTIEVRVTARDGQDARIAVSDEGIGIPPSDLPRIFEIGFRGGNTDGVPGMGLGLAGSRAVVRQMGGSLEVTSERGKGSVFTVSLPRVPSPEVPE